MTLPQKIDAPMFKPNHMVQLYHPGACEPGGVIIEARFPQATRAELEKRGHRLTVEGPWALGRICAVGRWGGFLRAAATPRLMQAYAAGREAPPLVVVNTPTLAHQCRWRGGAPPSAGQR